MRGLAGRLVSCALFSLVAITVANAEMKPLNPFAAEVAPAETAPRCASFGLRPALSRQQSPGAFGGIFGWVLRTQQSLQRDLATSVKSLKGEHAMAGAFMLAALSFIYGVVHAVGPGHGKTIISSYVVANEETVRRGVIISFIAAGAAGADGHRAGRRPCLRAQRLGHADQCLVEPARDGELRADRAGRRLAADDPTHRHLPALAGVARGRSACRDMQGTTITISDHDHHHHHHDHDHHHGHSHAEGEACHHIVDARELAGPFSWRKILAVVFSVGIRPCTGAILVLDLRADARHVLGRGGGDLRHGHRHRHHRRGAGNACARLARARPEARRQERCLCRCRVDDLLPRRFGPDPACSVRPCSWRRWGQRARFRSRLRPYCLLRNADG